MKKIAIVINTSWNIYNFRFDLLKELLKQYEVTCLAPQDDYSSRLEELGAKFINIEINNKGTNPIEDLKLINQYYKIFAKEKFDLVLLYTIKPNIYGNIAAKLAKTPSISTITGLGTVFLNEKLSSKIARQLYKHSLKFSKKVFFQNRDDMDIFISKKLVNKESIDYIPGSGINTELFKPSKLDTKDNRKTTFLMVARLVKDKGLLEYLNAARLLKQKYKTKVEFALLGEFYTGNPTAIKKAELQVFIDQRIVNYLGKSDDVKSVIENYDCVVLPSYREGLSRVLLEACSMKKPIVTTNVPGCKDLVSDGLNGYLCESRDISALCKSMENILKHTQNELLDMGEKSRKLVIDKYSSKIVIKKYLDIIPNLIKGN